MNRHANPAPPRVAVTLLSLALNQRYRDAVLGDMEEEFQLRLSAGCSNAHIWYWGQMLRSLSPLVGARLGVMLRQSGSHAVAAVMVGLFIVWAWDVLVAQAFAWRAASLVFEGDPSSARGLYAALYAIGFAGAGCFALSYTVGRTGKSPRDRVLTCSIMISVMAMPLLSAVYHAPDTAMAWFRSLQLGLSIGLLCSFWLVRQFWKKRTSRL